MIYILWLLSVYVLLYEFISFLVTCSSVGTCQSERLHPLWAREGPGGPWLHARHGAVWAGFVYGAAFGLMAPVSPPKVAGTSVAECPRGGEGSRVREGCRRAGGESFLS